MQHTTKYQQNDKTRATHNHLSTKRYNTCSTQPNINQTIKPIQHTTKYQQHDKTMQHTSKYQQNNKTHATHSQVSIKR